MTHRREPPNEREVRRSKAQASGDTSERRAGSRRLFRRGFLGALGAITAGTALAGRSDAAPGQGGGPDAAPGQGNGPNGAGGGNDPVIQDRVNDEFKLRRDFSREQLVKVSDTSPHGSNNRISENAVVSKFGKSLPRDGGTGLPAVDAYETLTQACESGEGYEGVPQARPDSRPLVQPETAWTYQSHGASTAQLRIATPPAFDSDEAGAEMVELYWRALTRDVKFRNYGSNGLVEAAVDELDGLNAYAGPGADSGVTPENVFRGVVPDVEKGPYISQLLWKDRELGGGTEEQKIEVQADGSDYCTDIDQWRKIQKGIPPEEGDNLPTNEFGESRYIITGRDLCERVHDDPPFRQIQKAAQVLIFTMDVPLDGGIPYTLRGGLDRTTQPFNDFGPLYIEKTAVEASEQGQRAAWHKKWNVHRRLRPEEYGGRVQAIKGEGLDLADGVEGAVPDTLLDSEALSRTNEVFGSYLLPQAYAEGSPTHPSYPAGHSVVAGAGATVLKALFDGDYEFGDKAVVPSDDGSELDAYNGDSLTIRGELNKLASNMALGRNRAGIHYRSDGIEGLRLGEAAAIRFLEDELALPTAVEGDVTLSFETFDGDDITITPTV